MNNVKIIQLETFDEEKQEYELEVDGILHPLSYTDHDMHGWDGMEAVRNVVEAFSKLLNIDIVVWEIEE